MVDTENTIRHPDEKNSLGSLSEAYKTGNIQLTDRRILDQATIESVAPLFFQFVLSHEAAPANTIPMPKFTNVDQFNAEAQELINSGAVQRLAKLLQENRDKFHLHYGYVNNYLSRAMGRRETQLWTQFKAETNRETKEGIEKEMRELRDRIDILSKFEHPLVLESALGLQTEEV